MKFSCFAATRFLLLGIVAISSSACSAAASDPGTGAGQSANDLTTAPLSHGFYEIASVINSARWIDAINFHADGSFEANLGNGVSNLSGHRFVAEGTYSVAPATGGAAAKLTLHYQSRGTVDETYEIQDGAEPQLRFVFDDGSLDGSFSLHAGPAPTTLHFDAGQPPRADGALTAGAPILVEYAVARDQCPLSANDRSVFLLGAVDDQLGAVTIETEFPSAPVNGTFRVIVSAPQGHKLALWFQNTTVAASGVSSCLKWDSNSGKNFNFDLH